MNVFASRCLVVVLLVTLVAVIQGCGGSDFSSPESVGRSMAEANNAEEVDAVIACFSKADQEQLRKMAEESPELLWSDGKMEFVEAKEVKGRNVVVLKAEKKSEPMEFVVVE